MNYRHAFHAGNFADVHKHIVLLALLERLKRKPKPLFYLDTHAGRGWYDLLSHDALRGREWQDGVGRVLRINRASPDLRRYLDAVSSPEEISAITTQRYPGSPVLAARELRTGDRVVFVEKQIAEAQALDQAMRGRRGVSVVCGDGYAALKTYLPPRENRGLVLIDPPYESENEFTQVERALLFGLSRWPNGTFALWYPIKLGRETQRLHLSLQNSGLRKLLLVELNVRPADSPLGLNGSGLIIANPPWQFDEEIAPALREAHAALAEDGAGGVNICWLVPE
ncbi:23S rRNA (adenine(2030)-N(6))-methyltransferase RlmJ [Steroidobacter sp. S1-65]|uniref:Ribosomal RNA large subunit methyltransferase J n=1 Tax=Steroidobacter gossypii TaxID=2805490 RepID=A0ABS1WTV4_9GAMM|nr:23S rRNA (adenine(2030)-N(6))-methyltransferase RlmJ [Steroidobacter gossypii]MBM0104409.1 23S rRNA (adenine(2030)-N(6))-methyltransferase RlmJ [Steroidobacter gossypii]